MLDIYCFRRNNKVKKILSVVMAAAVLTAGAALPAPMVWADDEDDNTGASEVSEVSEVSDASEVSEVSEVSDEQDDNELKEQYKPKLCSEEFRSSPFYEKLWRAKQDNAPYSVMFRVSEIAKSQLGYKNYSTYGIDIQRAREENKIWTGLVLRNNFDETGNTEYCRWAQSYIMDKTGNELLYDYDWCAIFVSWCMYQAGYYDGEELKRCAYAYNVDTRVEPHYETWIESYNLDQKNVWYSPTAKYKVERYSEWNHAVNTDISPYDMPYAPGGLLFFNWNGTGDWFNHIAIVLDYDENTHVLTYINGNDDGQVIIRAMDLDVTEEYYEHKLLKNANRIMAYAEYDYFEIPTKKQLIYTPNAVFDRSPEDTSTLVIRTQSESRTVRMTADNGLTADYKTKGLSITCGQINIGNSILKYLDTGKNRIHFELEDGSFDITINVEEPYVPAPEPQTAPKPQPEPSPAPQPTVSDDDDDGFFTSEHKDDIYVRNEPKPQEAKVEKIEKLIKTTRDEYEWEQGSKEGLKIKTDSASDGVKVAVNGKELSASSDEVSISDGEVSLSAAFLESNLGAGSYKLKLTFSDGNIDINVKVKQAPQKLTAERTDFKWTKGSSEGITVKTDSTSGSVKVSTEDKKEKNYSVSSGSVILPAKDLEEFLLIGDNSLTLDFGDGIIDISITLETEKPEEKAEESSAAESSVAEASAVHEAQAEIGLTSGEKDKQTSVNNDWIYLVVGIGIIVIGIAVLAMFILRKRSKE